MKERLVTLFGIAFVVAVVATGVFYGLVVSRLRAPVEASTSQQVVVAAKALDKGAVLHKSDLKVIQRHANEIPAGAHSRIEQVLGATLVDHVSENDPVVGSKLFNPRLIPKGMRVISVHATDSSGVVSMLQPGHKVDVQIVTMAKGEQIIRTILQKVEVLSASSADSGRPVVNLLVTPEDADILGLADSVARLRFLLRSDADAPRPVSAAVPSSRLMGSVSAAQ